MNKVCDFHTHISSETEYEKYLNKNILPIINCRNTKDLELVEIIKSKYKDNFYVSVGLHPFDEGEFDQKTYEKLVEKYDFVGEVGMDDCWSDVDKDIQRKNFINSLKVAKKYDKKVILHTKNMEGEILKIIKGYDLRYIVHWYSCENFIDEYIDIGAYFTIGAAILVDENIKKLVKKSSIEKLLIETDGLEAMRWQFRKGYDFDDPRIFLDLTLKEISKIKEMDEKEVEKIIFANSQMMILK